MPGAGHDARPDKRRGNKCFLFLAVLFNLCVIALGITVMVVGESAANYIIDIAGFDFSFVSEALVWWVGLVLAIAGGVGILLSLLAYMKPGRALIGIAICIQSLVLWALAGLFIAVAVNSWIAKDDIEDDPNRLSSAIETTGQQCCVNADSEQLDECDAFLGEDYRREFCSQYNSGNLSQAERRQFEDEFDTALSKLAWLSVVLAFLAIVAALCEYLLISGACGKGRKRRRHSGTDPNRSYNNGAPVGPPSSYV